MVSAVTHFLFFLPFGRYTALILSLLPRPVIQLGRCYSFELIFIQEAGKLCMNRLIQPRKGRPLSLSVAQIESGYCL